MKHHLALELSCRWLLWQAPIVMPCAGAVCAQSRVPESVMVTTSHGRLRGMVHLGMPTFKGIPYGGSVSRANRFQAAPRLRNGAGLVVGSKEDGRPEDALKGSNKSPILRTALLHSEGVQHLRRAAEGDRCRLLTNRKCREKDWNEPVLPPRQSVARVPSDLQNKLTISSLVQ